MRAIADAAGLSLGSTTYFFNSKAEIVHAAFTQLRDQASSTALEAIHQAGGSLNAALRPETEVILQPGRGFASLYLAGARSADLRPVALSVRSLVGQTGATWLAARRPGDYDRLDSFVWSLIFTAMVEAAAWASPTEPRAALGARLARIADRLFPPAAPVMDRPR